MVTELEYRLRAPILIEDNDRNIRSLGDFEKTKVAIRMSYHWGLGFGLEYGVLNLLSNPKPNEIFQDPSLLKVIDGVRALDYLSDDPEEIQIVSDECMKKEI